MRKVKNQEIIKGYIYEHKLAIKTVQNKESDNFGKPYISGTIDIATDEDCTNVITDRNKYIVVYCTSGIRSQKAQIILNSLGYNNVYNLKCGYIQ